jgi:hypothetical protein
MQHDSRAKGFGLVGLLLIIVVLAVVGGTGVYVYRKEHKVKAPVSNVSANAKAPTQIGKSSNMTTTIDPYVGWSTYTSSVAGYSIKYPANWTVRSSTNNGGAEDTRITSPDNFEIELLSFTKTSAYGDETLKSNSTGACGSTCLQNDKLTTFNAPKYGTIELDAQVQGAGGGSINTLALYTPSDSGYLVSPANSDVLTTISGVFQGQSEQESTGQTLSAFTSNATVKTAELVYESLAY